MRTNRESLREEPIERGSQNVVDTLDFSCRSSIEESSAGVEDDDEEDDQEEPLLDHRDEDDGTEDTGECREGHSNTVVERIVDRVDVLAESVHDSPQRCRVEE